MEMSGVTYFKLTENRYPGDVTKGCGLTGPEIDANFNFLRGYDIKSGKLDPDTGIITITRLNGEKIEIDGLAELLSGLTEFSLEGSRYDPEEGALCLVVNGVEQDCIHGFFTYNDIHTDCTLEGDGSEENPLKISEEFIKGIDDEIESAVTEEKNAREQECKEIKESLSAETERAQEAEQRLNEEIVNEAEARENADRQLSEDIQSEMEARTDADNQLSDRIDDEATARAQADSALSDEIEEEKNRATSAETILQEEIDKERGERESANTDILSVITQVNEALNEEAERAKTAENELSSAITEETEERISSDSALSEQISAVESSLTESIETEVERAKAAEEELSSAITEEKEERIASESAITDYIEQSVDYLESAITVEREEREQSDTELSEKIDSEIERAQSAETEITSALENEISERESAITELESAIQQEKEEREEAVNELQSSVTDIEEAISAIESSITDVVTTKDIVIPEDSPLYQFVAGIWEDNIIPSGTTLTELIEKLFSSDERMVYYIDSTMTDIDNVISQFGSQKKNATKVSALNYEIEGTEGAHIVGVALPKPHTLTSVSSMQSGYPQRITDKFFVNAPRELTYESVVYTVYYYKINVGLRNNDVYSVKIS